MKKALIALPLAALLLAGCSSTTAPPKVDPAGDAKATTQTTAAVADRSAKFGETVKYDSGVTVTLTSIGFQKVGQYAAGAVEGQAAVFELSVTNGSQKELSAALMSLAKVTYGDKNEKAASVIDSANNLGMETFSTILPGETQSVKLAAAIPAASAGTVRVEVTGPSAFTDKAAVFKGAVS
ncbi:hypothetical protein [Arthrobacter sp. MA-N2]|uniref:hypothetical protein n=1 Tax=Arthrobacter sp. MA-N2 TaxID=1101188 RepID=UPI0004899E8B|nr:hypothetical protein [Arthrobacter sp. MA-N2]